MIKFDADIVIASDGGEITSAESNIGGMQFSANINKVVNNRTRPIQSSPFIFGSSILGEGDTFSDDVKYFIGKELSQGAGSFSTPYEITVHGKNIKSLTFVFDTLHNEHPKSIYLYQRTVGGFENIVGVTGTETVPVGGKNLYYYSFEKTYVDVVGEVTDVDVYFKSDSVDDFEIKIKQDKHSISGFLYSTEANQTVSVFISVEVVLPAGYVECVSPIVKMSQFAGQDTAKVIIDNWNVANKPLKLQGIYINNNIHIDGANLISYEDSMTDRAKIDAPSYGVVSTSGRLTFIDLNNDVSAFAQNNLLVGDLELTAFVEDNKNKNRQKLATLYTEKWDYNADSKIVEVSLKDPLKKMQEVPITVNFTPGLSLPQSMKAIFDFLRDETFNCGIPIVTYEELPVAAKTILEITIVPCWYFEEGSLWQKWNSFCEVNSLHLFWDVDRVNFTYGA